jgi:2-C-methyl-D-erythritol 4-phosphate cytidylyltransferase
VAILGIEVVLGGKERSDSVEAALAHVKPAAEYVCVHDAARPCLADEWVDRIFEAGAKSGAAIFAVPIAGTIKRVSPDNTIQETVPRQGLWEAQTPQVFRRDWLLDAYAHRQGFQATDDAQLIERAGHKVTVVPGSPVNLKIATREDLRLAEQALKALPRPRFDGPLHPFAGDDLWR